MDMGVYASHINRNIDVHSCRAHGPQALFQGVLDLSRGKPPPLLYLQARPLPYFLPVVQRRRTAMDAVYARPSCCARACKTSQPPACWCPRMYIGLMLVSTCTGLLPLETCGNPVALLLPY